MHPITTSEEEIVRICWYCGVSEHLVLYSVRDPNNAEVRLKDMFLSLTKMKVNESFLKLLRNNGVFSAPLSRLSSRCLELEI